MSTVGHRGSASTTGASATSIEPYCPHCNIHGRDKIVARDSAQETPAGDPLFLIVQCVRCGHVYGVVPPAPG